MPNSLPNGEPSSVTATVECPVFALSAMMSAMVCRGVTLLSLLTKPDLDFFTVRTIATWDSMD